METKHNNIYEAMSALLGEIQDPALDSVNPHFKSKYSSLPAVLQAIRGVASKHGLSLVQLIDDGKLITKVSHTTGGEIVSNIALPQGGTMQALGSAITYARRYSLTALFGICGDEDDDGNQASTVKAKPAQAKPTTPSTLLQIKKILSEEGVKADGEALEFLAGIGVEIQNFNLSEPQLKNILTKLLIYKNEGKNKQNNQATL